MKAPIANATILTRTTSMPAPAADRSLARTASMAEPSRLVRSLATPNATASSTASTTRQNDSRGKSVPARDRRFRPNRADDSCAQRREERSDRKRDRPVGGHRAQQEAGHASQRQLGQRHLPGEPGDDDQRQRDDAEDQAGDQRSPPRAL